MSRYRGAQVHGRRPVFVTAVPAVICRGVRRAVAEPEGQPGARCWRSPFQAPAIAKMNGLASSGEGWGAPGPDGGSLLWHRVCSGDPAGDP